jgi:hypothetical protein
MTITSTLIFFVSTRGQVGESSGILKSTFMSKVSLAAAVVGAVGSVGLMLHGHHNTSKILLTLFTLWVLSPFIVLICAHLISRPWPAAARAALHGAMLAIAPASLAIYTDVTLGPPRATPAAVFLVVPAASCLLAALAVAIAALLSRRS